MKRIRIIFTQEARLLRHHIRRRHGTNIPQNKTLRQKAERIVYPHMGVLLIHTTHDTYNGAFCRNEYLLKKGHAKPNPSRKQKKRKRCRYERKHGLSYSTVTGLNGTASTSAALARMGRNTK